MDLLFGSYYRGAAVFREELDFTPPPTVFVTDSPAE
jgi:hypothetical protein